MHPLLTPYLSSPTQCCILDGALATELEARGADLKHPLWSGHILNTQPQLIEDVHRDYFQAGSNVAITSSYQVSYEGIAQHYYHGNESQESVEFTEMLLRRSVRCALDAKASAQSPQGKMVCASIGPYGAFVADGSEYRGNYGVSDDVLVSFHKRRIALLASTEADMLAIETVPSAREAQIITGILDSSCSQTPAWLSFSCRNGSECNEGQSIEECCRVAMASRNVVATGFNCTSPEYAVSLIRNFKQYSSNTLPIVCYPNSGEGWDGATDEWTSANASCGSLASMCGEWRKHGAFMIGGCCRTTPADTAQICTSLSSLIIG